MEGPSNGGMLYHEVQESKLCAVHCVNTVLQGPYFSEFDLAALASDLDRRERQMMLEGGTVSDDFLRFDSEESHNVSMDGDFSIQVLQKALEVWDLQVIPLDCPVAEPAQVDPELENAFICHLQDHWFSIRKVNGEWYNFNSLYAAPEHLSRFYLSAYLDTLKGFGWSIFLVRGNFPKECSIATAEANGFGQWLTPEDAQRITKSCNAAQSGTQNPMTQTQPFANSYQPYREEQSLSDMENEDLEAAIAASLMDSGPPAFTAETVSVIPPPAPVPSTTTITETSSTIISPSPVNDATVVAETGSNIPPAPVNSATTIAESGNDISPPTPTPTNSTTSIAETGSNISSAAPANSA